jgi:hypothetical protein
MGCWRCGVVGQIAFQKKGRRSAKLASAGRSAARATSEDAQRTGCGPAKGVMVQSSTIAHNVERWGVSHFWFRISSVTALSDPTARDWLVGILEKPDWSKSLVELAAGGGVVVLAGGHVFGTITVFAARVVFRCRPERSGPSRFHEVALSNGSFKQIWTRLKTPGALNRSQELLLVQYLISTAG